MTDPYGAALGRGPVRPMSGSDGSALCERAGGRNHRRWPLVHGVDDLGVIDAAQVRVAGWPAPVVPRQGRRRSTPASAIHEWSGFHDVLLRTMIHASSSRQGYNEPRQGLSARLPYPISRRARLSRKTQVRMWLHRHPTAHSYLCKVAGHGSDGALVLVVHLESRYRRGQDCRSSIRRGHSGCALVRLLLYRLEAAVTREVPLRCAAMPMGWRGIDNAGEAAGALAGHRGGGVQHAARAGLKQESPSTSSWLLLGTMSERLAAGIQRVDDQ